jgi:hypothetical protein
MTTGLSRIPRLAALALACLAAAGASSPTPTTAPAELTGDPALAAFERLKSLAGTWEAQSTAGWSGRSTYSVIARESAVLISSQISPHPGETMTTLAHLDNGRLLLTHYCVARNQPRLVATASRDGGRELVFTFLDGTGLRSRDQGHMDSAVYRFQAPDRFSSQWTWYEDGEERWQEEIHYVRVAADTAAAAPPATE